MGGILGSLLVAVLATETFSGVGLGDVSVASQFMVQAGGVAITVVWTAIASFVIFKIAGLFGGIRVSENDEIEGLDLTQHGERGYHTN